MQIILDMEKFKQNFHKKIQEAEHYLMWDSSTL